MPAASKRNESASARRLITWASGSRAEALINPADEPTVTGFGRLADPAPASLSRPEADCLT